MLVLLYLTNGYYAASPINTNEINHKSTRFNNNYCEAGLCPSSKKHIGCINKGHFGHLCPKDARVIKLDDYSKRLLLHMHNQHRSTIAEGKTPGFPPAVKMGALKWDDELAYLAELNAMSCEIEHDKVRIELKVVEIKFNFALFAVPQHKIVPVRWAESRFGLAIGRPHDRLGHQEFHHRMVHRVQRRQGQHHRRILQEPRTCDWPFYALG